MFSKRFTEAKNLTKSAEIEILCRNFPTHDFSAFTHHTRLHWLCKPGIWRHERSALLHNSWTDCKWRCDWQNYDRFYSRRFWSSIRSNRRRWYYRLFVNYSIFLGTFTPDTTVFSSQTSDTDATAARLYIKPYMKATKGIFTRIEQDGKAAIYSISDPGAKPSVSYFWELEFWLQICKILTFFHFSTSRIPISTVRCTTRTQKTKKLFLFDGCQEEKTIR
jgi:hypothetical protein